MAIHKFSISIYESVPGTPLIPHGSVEHDDEHGTWTRIGSTSEAPDERRLMTASTYLARACNIIVGAPTHIANVCLTMQDSGSVVLIQRATK